MDETEIYRKQQMGGMIAKGRKTALIIVDFANGFIDPDIFGGGNTLEAAEATIPVLDAFRSHSLPVVFTRMVYAEDGSDAGIWCEKVPRLRELSEANPASHIVDFLEPRDGDVIIKKTQPSAISTRPSDRFCVPTMSIRLRLWAQRPVAAFVPRWWMRSARTFDRR